MTKVRFSCLEPSIIVNEIATDKMFGGECSQIVMKGMSYHLLINTKFDNSLAELYPRKSKESLFIAGPSESKFQMQFYKDEKWEEIDIKSTIDLSTLTGK